MTDTLTEPKFARITGYADSAAVFDPGWLPDLDAFPELVEARAEYLRLRDAWQATGERRSVIQSKIDNDRERRELALRDSYLAGNTTAQLEDADEALRAELENVKAQANASAGAFLEHINRCIALVIERREAWFAVIDEYQHGIDEDVAALAEQIAKLRTKRGNFARFEHWAERTGGRVRPPTSDRPGTNQCGATEPYAHIQYSEVPAPDSGVKAEDEARLAEFFMKSYAGWDGSQKPLTSEQGKALEQHLAEARTRPPEKGVELNELDEDDLVDWLMSTGAFDGHAKPGADLVVAAAEGNAAMASRLLKAEGRANEAAPRKAVVDQLEQIVGAG